MKYFGDEGKEYLMEHLFFGSLPEFQSDPLIILVDKCLEQDVFMVEQIAYVLATAYHESNRFKAKEEYRKGMGKRYGIENWIWSNKKESYHGRGWVQLTWLGNYGKMSAHLSSTLNKPVDLINDPDLIIKDDRINAYITVVGMKRGMFTGKKLENYIDEDSTDYVNARRIVNGMDKASLIAGYAKHFEEALRNGP
jgi:hypothetical protein